MSELPEGHHHLLPDHGLLHVPVPEQPSVMTPEQWAFLAQFSGNYVAGRKFMCWMAHALVGIGFIAGAAAAIATAYHVLLGR